MGDARTHLGRKCVLGITHNSFEKLGIGLMAGYVNSVHKNLSFYLSCILRDLPQQKFGRELCDGADPSMILCSHGKIF